MTLFIFIGDMLVMAFMIGLIGWLGFKGNSRDIEFAANIPLDDEEHNG
jgi:hypothetical protein